MSDYTPTTKTVLAYIRGNAVLAGATANEAQDAAVGWLASVERSAAEKAILKLSGTKQAEAFDNAVDIRAGKRKPLFISVVRGLREEAEEYRREEDE